MQSTAEFSRLAGLVVLAAEAVCACPGESEEAVWHELIERYFAAVRELQAMLPEAAKACGKERVREVLAPALLAEDHLRDKLTGVCNQIARELAEISATRANLGRISDGYGEAEASENPHFACQA